MTAIANPRRTLPGIDVVALTVGIVIGAGIFRTPALVAGVAPDATTMMIAWALGGFLSIVGALCYAEMAAAWPHFGGDYHFLGRAYGERVAFLYAWARLTVIQTGSIALLAFIVGDYLQVILPLGPVGPAIWAGLAVIVVSAINWLGMRWGAAAQRWLTLLEIVGLVTIIIAGFAVSPAGEVPAPASEGGALGLMMVFVLLAYGGWSEAVYVSAEMKDPPRRMAVLMTGALILVTVLYVLVNLAFLNSLGFGGMAASEAVAAEVMRRALGDWGAVGISIAVGIAALTSANATVITGGRTACALGRRVRVLSWLGRWDGARDTPANAIVAQAAIALLLVAAGGFARDGFRLAVEYTAPVFWTFLLMVGIALFVLRRRYPDQERPFRVPLYPILPGIFCATAAYLLWSSLAYTGWGALVGVAVLAAGGLLIPMLKPEEETTQ
ncbi:MAG: amino acid permease [Alphaproteobacteria bacterium HGW-Alphaproteobacteria-16]|nr:MAG: amino acid permease [Alphaproteobacteria bacterium HGW-Alphaproteobacteria-16]